MSEAALRKTPLNAVHRALGAKMVDFGGWDMPVQYSGIIDEHNAVRNSVGLFDVSHMGEIEIRGPEAAKLVDFVSTNNAAKLKHGQAHYSGLLYEHGGFVDDILVHKVADDDFFLCVNASNQEKDFEHIRSNNRLDAEVDFASDRYSQLAIQGPNARATLQKLTPVDLAAIKYYWFTDGEVCGTPARIAHTGYTGEDGYEIYIPPAEAERIWNEIMKAGAEFGIKPAVWARATRYVSNPRWRFTATRSTPPFPRSRPTSPGSSSSTSPNSWAAKRSPSRRKAASPASSSDSKCAAAASAATVMRCLLDGAPAGWVTSGGPSPTLCKNIGLCYLPAEHAVPGKTIQVVIRNQPVDAVTVETPFYKRAK